MENKQHYADDTGWGSTVEGEWPPFVYGNDDKDGDKNQQDYYHWRRRTGVGDTIIPYCNFAV